MAFCPNCEAEYLDHVRMCIDCDVELVNALPEEDEGEQDVEPIYHDSTFETVYEDNNTLNAQMALKLLEANGFRPKMQGQHEANYPPMGPYRVQVPAEFVAEARELIEAYANSNLTEFEAQ